MDLDREGYGAHISQQFNKDLENLKNHILNMGGRVERQIQNAIKALLENDSELAEKVRQGEAEINGLEVSIDEECTRILALRHPAASDLRMVVAVYKAITDLERIGDEASKVASLAIGLIEEGAAPLGYGQTKHIGHLVTVMVHDALDAFARFDVDSALRVMREDRTVDVEYDGAMRQLITYMMEDPRSISRVLKIMWALRALERVGDHACNIAEHVVYLVKGKDVRHASEEQLQQALLAVDRVSIPDDIDAARSTPVPK